MEKRHGRMSKIQKENFISLLERNKFLLDTKLKPSDLPKAKRSWMEIATILNQLPGATKNVKEWKDALNEMKVNVRRKARIINIDNHGTGGGPKKGKDLTELEERLLALLSKVVITGLPEITEFGLEEQAGSSQNSTHYEVLESIDNVEFILENSENIGPTTNEVELFIEEPAENISEPSAATSSKPQKKPRENISEPSAATSSKPQKKKRFETNTERLAKNHEKCLRVLAESNNNLARATYTLAKIKLKKPSAVFSLKF